MQLTKSKLKHLIKEELRNALSEDIWDDIGMSKEEYGDMSGRTPQAPRGAPQKKLPQVPIKKLFRPNELSRRGDPLPPVECRPRKPKFTGSRDCNPGTVSYNTAAARTEMKKRCAPEWKAFRQEKIEAKRADQQRCKEWNARNGCTRDRYKGPMENAIQCLIKVKRAQYKKAAAAKEETTRKSAIAPGGSKMTQEMSKCMETYLARSSAQMGGDRAAYQDALAKCKDWVEVGQHLPKRT